MAVYLILDVDVRDEAAYAEYTVAAEPIVRQHGGRYLARGGAIRPLAGDWQPKRVVIVEFDSFDSLRACFGSSEYAPLLPLRDRAAVFRAVAVEGVGS